MLRAGRDLKDHSDQLPAQSTMVTHKHRYHIISILPKQLSVNVVAFNNCDFSVKAVAAAPALNSKIRGRDSEMGDIFFYESGA